MSEEPLSGESESAESRLELILLIAHEIRAPLGIVKESISLVVDKVLGKTNEKQQHVLTTARRNVDRIDRVIMNLVDSSKLDARKMELQKEFFDLMGVIRQVLDQYGPAADAQHLALKAVSPQEKVELNADKQRIASVLKHLVGNAIKFTEKGSIQILVEETADRVRCAVRDTGIGISKEDLPKLFGKFRQMGWAPGGGEKGMGLGLAITKGIIELHGGTVRAESEPDKGSTFTFDLPKAAR